MDTTPVISCVENEDGEALPLEKMWISVGRSTRLLLPGFPP